MQITKPLRSSIDKIKIHVRSLRVWVLELFAWWVLAFGSSAERISLRRDIREARSQARELIFLMMISRMTFQKHARQWMRPPSARSGFRYAHRRLNLVRLYTRGIRLRSLRDIRDVLNDFERVVQRAIKRVPKTVATGSLVISQSAPGHATPATGRADDLVRAPDTS
jgi:hypothetical protein